jgi:hypothetical protein
MREYVISAGGITLANQAVTLVFVNPAAGPSSVIEVYEAWVNQSGSTTSAQQRVQLVTQVTAFPTLTSQAPKTTKLGDPASVITGGTAGAAGTSGINASAEGAGTKTVRVEDAFNVLNGWHWGPYPTGSSSTIQLRPGELSGFGLHLPVAPTSLANWAFGINFREVG